MSKNIDEVYMTNPITENVGTDLMYFGQSPYGADNDAAMLFSDFEAQLGGGVTSTQVQQSAFNNGTDTGTSTAYAVTLSPAISSYTDGLLVSFTPQNNNTTIFPTLDVNGNGTKSITISENIGYLALGDINASTICYVQYSDEQGAFILLNPQLSNASSGNVLTGNNYWVGAAGGVANDYDVTIPFSTAYDVEEFNPIFLVMAPAIATNTDASTVTISGLGPFPIVNVLGGALTGGEIISGKTYFFVFDSAFSQYILINSSLSQLQSNPLITNPGVDSQSSALSIGSAYHNTFGYDVMVNVYLEVASATAADITLGVGSTNSPTPQTIVSAFTTAVATIITVPIYIPSGYYALLDTSGTISVSISGQQALSI